MKRIKTIFTKWQIYFVFGLVVAVVLFGVWNISADGRIHRHGFCADMAFEHVYAISQEPRSVYDKDAIDATRQYIMSTLTGFNVENFMVEHTPVGVPVNNIYARIAGSSGTYVLLMAHYDSHPWSNSTGVGDNGYAVATLLEIAGIFSKRALETPLVNGIKFVFTDAEEIGLFGAIRLVEERKIVTEHNSDWILDNVNLVVNVEGRGIRGPLFMFETSANNRSVVNFYARAGRPFGFSFAAEIYRILPMNTELGIFLNAGFNGINLSVLDSVEYYHTDYDNLDNISMRALQNYGNTLVPLMIEYTTRSKYSGINAFDSSVDSVFFTLLPNIFVRYSSIFSWILIGLLFIGLIFILILIKNKVKISRIIFSIIIWLLLVGVSAGLGFLTTTLLAIASGADFSIASIMSFIAFDRGALILTSIFIYVLAFLMMLLKSKVFKINMEEMKFGGIFVNIMLLVVSAFLLHGATFLFLWPALLAILGLFSKLIKRKNIGKYLSIGLNSLMVIFAASLCITISYSLFVGMTISVLTIILALTATSLTIVVPTICDIIKNIWENPLKKCTQNTLDKKIVI